MMNQVILVGRIAQDLEIKEQENGNKVVALTLAVQSSFKNENGEYETDFIPCRLWDSIATNTCEYCKKGDVVGIKGRIEMLDNNLTIIAERVSFLSSKSE